MLSDKLTELIAAATGQKRTLDHQLTILKQAAIVEKSGANLSPADFYRKNGYHIFRGVLSRLAIDELVRALESEVESATGQFLRHPRNDYQINKYVKDISGRQVVENSLSNPHRQPETPLVAKAIRQLLCTESLADLLTSIDGAPSHTIHQTMLFFMSPGTDMHMDGWGLDSVPFGYSHTLWVPLEPVTLLNGALALVPWPVGRVLMPAELGLGDSFLRGEDEGARNDYHDYHDRLTDYIRRHDPVCVVPQLEPGDLVVFASLTPHRTLPGDMKRVSRKAMQVMLRDSSREWGAWPQLLREGTPNAPDEPGDRLQTVNQRWRIMM